MLSFAQIATLILFYTFSIILILHLAYRSFQQQRFSFHLLFTLVYLLTFYLGFPFSMALALGFDVSLQSFEMLFATLFSATAFYILYYVAYKLRLSPLAQNHVVRQEGARLNSKTEAKITAFLLLLIAMGTVAAFYSMNGLLLFKLDSYSQIFSQQVSGTPLKRFFYFFMPALLIIYFLYQNKKAWFAFLILGVAFGALTYMLVGGTRANIALSVALFLFIGIAQGYISLKTLWITGALGIIAMFALAIKRYGLNVSGAEALYTFLYLTRDTFSPWENLSLLLNNYENIEFQGLAPILRDFYVFIPKTLWENRPDLVVNSANYFTWEILNYYAGLAISPTILGSLFIMGGIPFMLGGAVLIGLLVKGFDQLYFYGKALTHKSHSAIIQAFCFANIFNVIVLVREGLDAFVSRFVFFSLIFGACYLFAILSVACFRKMGFVSVKSMDVI